MLFRDRTGTRQLWEDPADEQLGSALRAPGGRGGPHHRPARSPQRDRRAPPPRRCARGLEEFEADEAARVLVLTGSGEAFCAGADLKAMDLDVDDPGGPLGFTRLTPSKPAIAAIDGWCLAGGLELALWCDLRVATPRSTFGCFERRWGVPLVDGGTQRLPRVVGMGRALEMILTGRPVEAEEAERIGLVNELIEPGEHLERALRACRADRRVPAGDDAERPPRRPRGCGHAACRGARAERRSGARCSRWRPGAPPASPGARAAAARRLRLAA